jgi:hypothetical protein
MAGSDLWQTVAQQLAAATNNPYLYAQVQAESSFNPTAVSSEGCQGIAQICDSVNFDPFDPMASLQYMATRMQNAFSLFGNWRDALASYNCGVGCATKCQGQPLSCYPAETQAYVTSIMGSGSSAPSASSPAPSTPTPSLVTAMPTIAAPSKGAVFTFVVLTAVILIIAAVSVRRAPSGT